VGATVGSWGDGEGVATLEDVLGRSVRATRSLFAAAACSVALVDDEGETLTYVVADGAGAKEIVGVTIPVGRGIGGWAAMSGQPIAVRDVQTDARFARDVAESTNYVPSAILAAPLMTADGEVIGVTSVLDADVDETSDWTLHVLGTLASHMALLVTGARDEASQGGQSASGPDAGLDALGRDVVRLVQEWQVGRSPGGAG
jgi:signal transduction protein with GAF and PtsI domain